MRDKHSQVTIDNELQRMDDERARLRAENARLREALQPFAYLAEVMEEGQVLNFRGVYVTHDQVVEARAAIREATE
jgi:hypothetical protein